MLTPTLEKTLSNSPFPETSGYYRSFTEPSKNLIAIATFGYPQWSGRHIPSLWQSLLLYDLTTLRLIACFDKMDFKVNALSFHPDSPIVAIATGSYDGGAYYEGTLLLWNYKTGEQESVFVDNREVTTCAFTSAGRKLTFSVSPTDDLDDQPYVLTTYEIDYLVGEKLSGEKLSLESLTPISTEQPCVFTTREEYLDRFDHTRQQLTDLAGNAGHHFLDKEIVWDLLFLDERRLVAARNNSTIEIWNFETGKARMIWLPIAGECVQVFYNTATQTLLANCWARESPSQTFTVFFSIDLSTFAVTEIIRCHHTLSKTAGNYFLARQTDSYNKTLEDFILDPDYNIVYIKRLGHFDLFNHSIRIDNAISLYFLAGNPSEQHQNKILYRIDSPLGKISEVWPIERQPDHFNDINAILYGETVILSGGRFRASADHHEMFAYDPATGKILWQITLPGKVSALTAMEAEAVVIAALTNGQILFIDVRNGLTVKTITPDANLSFQRPASLAFYRDTLAVGLMNGEIRIYEC